MAHRQVIEYLFEFQGSFLYCGWIGDFLLELVLSGLSNYDVMLYLPNTELSALAVRVGKDCNSTCL